MDGNITDIVYSITHRIITLDCVGFGEGDLFMRAYMENNLNLDRKKGEEQMEYNTLTRKCFDFIPKRDMVDGEEARLYYCIIEVYV